MVRGAEGREAGSAQDRLQHRREIPMTARPPASQMLRRLVTVAVIAGWISALAVPPVLLLRARQAWLERLDRPEEQTRWDEFRRDMVRQTGREGPVQRKVPRSAEPPARVWLRDHASLAVTAWILFVGVLGGVFSLLVAGVMRGDGRPSLAQDQPGREGDHDEQDQRDAENTKQ